MVDGGERQTLVVVGNGMICHALCRRLVHCEVTRGDLRVVVFGEERRPAYDRVRLTELLAGRAEDDLTLAPAAWYEEQGVEIHLGDPVVAIDRDECLVRSRSGRTVSFDRLVLATGSRPFVPPIPGAEGEGVLVYRTVDDLHAVAARAARSRSAAVIGGGLLGLEAARAVHALGLEVHVIEASPGLLRRQLDPAASRLLGALIEALGVRVRTSTRTRRIEARPDAFTLHFADESRLDVDMVILAAGVRPRDELASAAGLAVAGAGGVLVDDHLQTSDPRVFAVGECASHRGVTYGLLAPGLAMIDVLVNNLGGGDAAFTGASTSARLKLLGVQVASLGRPDEAETPGAAAHAYLAGDVYRKLVIKDGRIIGALAVGAWDDLPRVEDAIAEPRRFSFWDLRRFRGTGSLFLRSESPPVHAWPPEALVCGCLGVRRGALTEAEIQGCATVDAIAAHTGAGTMCGSCRPLLADYLQRDRIDSLPPSQIGLVRPSAAPPPPESSEGSPLTLRCHGRDDAALDNDGPLSVPDLAPLSEVPISEGPLSLRRPGTLPAAWPARRPHFDTLQSALAEIAPPPSAVPVSGPAPRSATFEAPPSTRRETMPPLRPISVPPGRLPSIPPARLAPSPDDLRAERRRIHLAAASIVAAAGAAITILAPGAGAARSFSRLSADAVIIDPAVRTGTGAAIVALSLAGLLLSLRKRVPRFTFSDFHGLRVLHGVIGAATLACLAAHTGLHLGAHLNRALMIDFLATALLGAVAGAFAAAPGGGDPAAEARRRLVFRAHLVAFLPLPVLVALHVLGALYF